MTRRDGRRKVPATAPVCRKSPPAASFSEFERCFPLGPLGLPGGKQRKESLHSKGSESAAHVAGFGLHLESCGPPNLPTGFFDSLTGASWNGAPVFSSSGLWRWGRGVRALAEGARYLRKILIISGNLILTNCHPRCILYPDDAGGVFNALPAFCHGSVLPVFLWFTGLFALHGIAQCWM